MLVKRYIIKQGISELQVIESKELESPYRYMVVYIGANGNRVIQETFVKKQHALSWCEQKCYEIDAYTYCQYARRQKARVAYQEAYRLVRHNASMRKMKG